MPKFYFTYGTEGQPFYGGWTEIEAPTRPIACTIFKMIHPCKPSGFLNCSSVYDEDDFQQTKMYKKDNFGYRCHERISLQHEIFTKKGVNTHLMQEGNHGILFYGPPGTGKTFYACCIANELIDKGIFALVTSIPRILGFQGGYEAEAAMRSELATADLLIIDDLGAERDTSYADEKVFDIIDLRYRAKKPLIVTTNLSIKEMEEAGIQKRRIYDRVQEMCNIRVQIDGPSIRTQVAKQKRQEAQKILSNRKAGEHERPSKT